MSENNETPQNKPKRTRAKKGEPKKPRTWVNKIKASKSLERFEAKTRKEQERERQREARKQAIIDALERTGKELKPYQQIGLKTGSYVFDLDVQARFCEEYAKHGRKKQAADVAGVSIHTVNRYLSADLVFKDMFSEAMATYRDHIAEEVYRRAVIGVDKMVLGGQFKDEILGYEKVYSDRLLEMEAKRVEPGYRDKGNIDIAVKEGGVLVINTQSASVEDWESQYKDEKVIDVTPS